MSFSDQQIRRLKAKLDIRRVKSRSHEGRELSYVEGWYVMAEANRIFGFDGWDRLSHSHQLLYERHEGETFHVAYHARVRVIVRAGPNNVVREGSGFGSAINANPGDAHELALKVAETDATKRALATFGNRFGLSLYDKDQAGVKKPPLASRAQNGGGHDEPINTAVAEQIPAQSAAADKGGSQSTHSALVFLKALRERLRRTVSLVELDEIVAGASSELERVRDAHPDLRDRRGQHLADVITSVAALKRQDFERGILSNPLNVKLPALRLSIDKSSLALATTKRHRDKDHLKSVAAKPCLVCGRVPAQAHHIRFAQTRGMGLKVSDEFTVPLCAIDHDSLHRSGNESRWWKERRIDPLPHADALWRASRESRHLPATPNSGDAVDTAMNDRSEL